jgi:hypothetical protein
MVKGIFSSTLLGGLIVWIWILISWTVLPWHCNTIKSFENESVVQEAISAIAKEDGIYVIPGCKNKLPEVEDVVDTIQKEKFETRQIIFMSLNSSGFSSSVIPIAVDFLFRIVSALFVSLVVMLMAASSYGWKLFAITLLGLFAGIQAEVSMWIWFGFPLDSMLIGIADSVIAWFLAGIVMAGLIRPKHQVS